MDPVSGGSVVKNLPASAGDAVDVGKIPWRRKWQPHSGILAWKKSRGQRSLVGYSPWGRTESDMTEHAGYG